MKQVNTGGLLFPDLRKRNKYYVDKTLLIKDVLSTDEGGVYLFTRPRRFGKTTNLSMLDAFFNIKYKGNTWFDGLAISDYPEYEGYKNAFPVIHLNLKDTIASTFEEFEKGVCIAVLRCFMQFENLFQNGHMSDVTSTIYESLKEFSARGMVLINSISFLAADLESYYGSKPILLIDEYDRAVSDAFGQESHRPMMDFLSSFLSVSLKNNEHIQMAYITGVMQIAKESIFSGLNNITVNNVFSVRSDERFGFTEAEVKELFEYYGHPEKFPEAKEWYDGYRFGNAEVYNPFSIMNYVSNDFTPEAYWANSGSDVIMRRLLEQTNMDNISDILSLISGGSIEAELYSSLVYSELYETDDASLYSLMVMSGYLKAVPVGRKEFTLSIPNFEIMDVLDDVIRKIRRINTNAFADFIRAIMNGDSDRMESELQRILLMMSYLNLVNENHYELVIVTALFGLLPSYSVRSELESGNGRVDIILTPKRESIRPIIIELKKIDKESELESEVKSAIGQIHDRKYYLGMTGEVLLIGMAFWGKMPKIITETVNAS